MMTTWKWGGSWLALVGLLVLVGCGGDDVEKPEEESPKSAEGQTAGEQGSDAVLPPDPPRPPRVVITISQGGVPLGQIPIDLTTDRTAITTTNFLNYVQSGYYDGTVFHEVQKGYVIQGGALDHNYEPKPPGEYVTPPLSDPTISNEARDGLSNVRGTIAMARDPNVSNSAVAKFFFNLSDNSHDLDYQDQDPDNPTPQTAGYCAFGTVTAEGLAVLDRISDLSVDEVEYRPATPVIIDSIERVQ